MIKKLFPAFGTINSVELFDDCDSSILDQIKRDMLQMHNRFTFFSPNSEIDQINQNAGTHPVTVSEDTFSLLSLALTYARDTKGTFDVTAGSLSELWRNAIHSAGLPSDTDVEVCRTLCGIQNLELDHIRRTAFLSRKGAKIDLGGIVKGYAADVARRMLREYGIQNARINFGGTVVAIGRTQKIGIQNPFQKTGNAMACIPLKNKAVVTSGAYEQCFFHRGERFHHIIDPRTGKPSRSGLISVSLIGDEAVTLDALATGICCLGAEAGLPIVRRYGISAVFVTDHGRVQITPDLQGQISFDGSNHALLGRAIS